MGKRSIGLDELRKKLGVETGEYKKYSDFKRRVILQAIKEINEFSDIEIDFTENKESKKVTAITFLIYKNQKSSIQEGIQTFQSKNKEELAVALIRQLKKKFKFDFPPSYVLIYSKNTIIELLCALLRGVYDEKQIDKPVAYF